VAVLGPDAASAGQSLAALGINSMTSLVAGAALGSMTPTLARHPGLLVMVPAAIGLRGNVFSALGSRISTAVHAGTYRPSLRRGTVLGDNVAASIVLSLVVALALAVVAEVVTLAFAVEGDVSLLDLATISIVGGLLASAVVLVATIGLVVVAVRSGWDLDNLVAPVVSTLGDVVTVPSLWAASYLLGHRSLSGVVAVVAITAVVAVGVSGWRSARERLRRIVRESLPVLVVAASLSTMAGLVLEKQFLTFDRYPALLVLVPAFVSSAGALGGLLASSLGTSLHLGTVRPSMVPSPATRVAVRTIVVLAVPVYALNGIGADYIAHVLGHDGPSAAVMVAVSLLGAVGAVSCALGVAYYGTIAAVRLRVDPDTYGIPIVTSSVDFLGAVALILAVSALGLT
jgi:mgtE-like transporter